MEVTKALLLIMEKLLEDEVTQVGVAMGVVN